MVKQFKKTQMKAAVFGDSSMYAFAGHGNLSCRAGFCKELRNGSGRK